MIKGQKKLNVTYMASVIEDGERIEGEACMDIQMAEDIADLLLQDKEEVRQLGKDAILKGMNFEEAATTRERNHQIGGHKSGV